jgi:iron complex outermembrane recepter protein
VWGLLLLLLLAVGTAGAQEPVATTGGVAGIIVDAETRQPLPAVAVRLLERHQTEHTHGNGGFIIGGLPPGTYTLVLERLGYTTTTRQVSVRAGETTRLRIELPVAAIRLGEVVVTGSLSARAGQDVLSPTSVVAGAELDRKLDGTVAATLDREPGVAVTSIGPATARPVIRGLGGDRILILEDGLRPGDLSSTSGDHAVAIEPLTAEQFEVVRGPMSLLYGSSALGGVVNVVRNEIPAAVAEHTHGAVMLQGASVNRSGTIGGYATTTAGAFALRAEGSIRDGGEVRTPLGPLRNTDVHTVNLSFGGAYVPEWGHTGASYRYYASDYGIPGGFVGGHAGGVDIQMRRHMGRGEVEVHRPRDFFSTIHASAAFTAYNHLELEQSGAVGTEFFQDLAAGEVIARHGTRGLLALGAMGLRAQYRDIQTGGSLRTPSTYDFGLAAFAVEELGHGPLRGQVGARFDWSHYTPRDTTATIIAGGRVIPVRERSFGSVSGSAGLLYAISEPVRLGMSVSRAYRTPDFNELYSDGPHLAANSFDVGDPSLDPETGLGMDVFFRYGQPWLRAEAAVFANQLSNYIFPSSRGRAELGTAGGRPRFQFTNEDARFVGFEGDVEWNFIRNTVLEGTFSYVRARFTSDRAPIPVFEGLDTTFVAASLDPPLIPPALGRLGVRHERQRWFAAAAVRLAARQDRLGDFETPTEGYAIGNLSGGIRMADGGRLHTITLRIDNVLDAEYRDHLSRIKEIMPEPGRNVSLLYRVTF